MTEYNLFIKLREDGKQNSSIDSSSALAEFELIIPLNINSKITWEPYFTKAFYITSFFIWFFFEF